MVDIIAKRTEELSQAMRLFHFGFRAFVNQADERLARKGYSRTHHRVLFFIKSYEGRSVQFLLSTLKVSKQALNKPLRTLIRAGYVAAEPDPADARSKRLILTRKGAALERVLSDDLRSSLAKAFRAVGPAKERAWRETMSALAQQSGRPVMGGF